MVVVNDVNKQIFLYIDAECFLYDNWEFPDTH